jgi:hypothetical protein
MRKTPEEHLRRRILKNPGDDMPLLGDAYVERGGVTVIIVLAVTSVIRTVFILWTSLQRALQRTAVLLRVNIGFAWFRLTRDESAETVSL